MTHEILVHISTSTTRQNDDLYCSLADAYLDFEPCQTFRGTPKGRETRADCASIPRSNTANESRPSTGINIAADTSILSTSKESYGSFPSYLSFDERDRTLESASMQDIGSPEGHNIPSSSRLARLENLHTQWRQETPKSSTVDKTRPLPMSPVHPDTQFIEDTQLAAQALQSQLQDISFELVEEEHRDELDIDSNTRESRVSRVEHDSDSSYQSTVESISDPLDFTLLPVDAFPRAPGVSIAQPGALPSQTTTYLSAIKTQNPTRFKPLEAISSPNPDERGYWSIDSSTWPYRIQHDFWSTLCDHVESGRLGWGITLHRDNGSSQALGRSKLYCWGEVVEHTWLLLWLCSSGKISGTGSKWLDADGVDVIIMP